MRLAPPWLILDLRRDRRVLSFAPHRPGFVTARNILWRQVRNADLDADLDAAGWLAAQVAALGHADAVGMMTSRALRHACCAVAGPVTCVATVGLGNAERVGFRRGRRQGYGTINIALLIEAGLTDSAMIEALTIAAQARTLAVLQAGLRLPAGLATGTGTDCIALACDAGQVVHAGLHTDLGEAIGAAVCRAVGQGAADWMAAHGARLPDTPG